MVSEASLYAPRPLGAETSPRGEQPVDRNTAPAPELNRATPTTRAEREADKIRSRFLIACSRKRVLLFGGSGSNASRNNN
ncbi:MAG: hypothetical protein EAZ91_12010 [Cytophagales bacterium]|nr:MAG: hypothetical protein EAZ91_12010 [Cytophagales bacterium]